MNKNKKDYGYVDHLTDRKEKPYRLRIQVNGKRKIYYFTTKEEALTFKDQSKVLKDKVYRKGETYHASILTLFREWIKEKELTVSTGSIVGIKNAFKHLVSLHGQWLGQISKDDCLNLMRQNPSKGLHLAFSVLSEINKYSLEKHSYGFNWNIDGLIKGFKPRVKSHKRVRSFYREDEMILILHHLKKKDIYWYHFFRLGFSLGARIGEICSLKKYNYHKGEKVLIIDSTIQSVSIGEKVALQDSNSTKNDESRSIALSSSAIESIDYFLSLHKKNGDQSPFIIKKKTKSKYLFLSKSTVNLILKNVSSELGLIYLPSHCAFRKTFATMMAMKSKKSHRDMISAIQTQLGHKSPQMTLYYIQSIALGLSEELDELDKILN